MDTEKKRMLVSSRSKGMCMRYDLKEVAGGGQEENSVRTALKAMKGRLEYMGLHRLTQERTLKKVEGYASFDVHIFKDSETVPLF